MNALRVIVKSLVSEASWENVITETEMVPVLSDAGEQKTKVCFTKMEKWSGSWSGV